MISFNYLNKFILTNEDQLSYWISSVISSEGFKEDEINYIFCDDEYLQKLNVEFLNHDTLTDIISFDYSVGKIINGDIYISTRRVKENAKVYCVAFEDEMYRVIIHGVLHYCGYKDKSINEISEMRAKEDFYLKQLQ